MDGHLNMTMDDGRWTMDGGRWTVDDRRTQDVTYYIVESLFFIVKMCVERSGSTQEVRGWKGKRKVPGRGLFSIGCR
jgi:hypothetical protein